MAVKPRSSCVGLALILAAAFSSADEKPAAETGWVRLPLSDYEALLRAARTRKQRPPVDAAFASTQFLLDADRHSARLRSTIEVISLTDKPQTLPLPDLGPIYASESSDPDAALLADDSGAARIRIPRRGHFLLRLRSAPGREEKNGAVNISWKVPDSPSNRLFASIPPGHGHVILAGGTASVSSERGGSVRLEATLGRGQTIRLTYAVAASESPEEKLLASATESRLYRIDEKSLAIVSRLRVEVLRGTLREFTVEAPPEFRVVSAIASANTVTSFEPASDGPGRLTLRLGHGVTSGTEEVLWVLRRETPLVNGELRLPEIGLPDFLRGETAVAVASPKPLVLDDSKSHREGYERIDESDLPSDLRQLLDSPVLLAARRTGGAAPSLAIHLSSFPDATGLSGVIDQAKFLTIATREGRRIDRWQLELQSRESILRLSLPEGGELWSVQLDGKPVRPLTEKGQLLISLGHGEKALRPRNVEIVVAAANAILLPKRGEARIELPKLPYPTISVEWDLLLPDGAEYRFRGGNLSPEEGRREPGVAGGALGGVLGGAAGRIGEVGSETGTGKLSGRVTDQNRSVLPGATVTISRHAFPWQRTTTTNAEGFFLFTDVPAGTFRVSAELAGFNRAERSIALPQGGNIGAELQMKLGSAQETITVSGEVPLLDATKSESSFSASIDARRPARQTVSDAKHRPPETQRPALSEEERAALQRTLQVGIAAIPVELPTTGKRLQLAGYLFLDETPTVQFQVRPTRKSWWIW